MMGFYIKREHIEKLLSKKYKILAGIILLVIAVCLYINLNEFSQLLNMSTGKVSYKQMNLSGLERNYI